MKASNSARSEAGVLASGYQYGWLGLVRSAPVEFSTAPRTWGSVKPKRADFIQLMVSSIVVRSGARSAFCSAVELVSLVENWSRVLYWSTVKMLRSVLASSSGDASQTSEPDWSSRAKT